MASILANTQKTGEARVLYREHSTKKYGVKKDRQWRIRQSLGNIQRVSVLSWWSAGITLGDAINKAAEYKFNNKWNKSNPDRSPKPICKQDEDNTAERLKEELELKAQRKQREEVYLPTPELLP